MFIRWTDYKCPSCNACTDSRMVGLPKVGTEHKDCRKCGFRYRTPDKEWRDMTKGQRVGYFVVFAGATFCIFAFMAIVFFVADKSDWQFPAMTVAMGLALCTPFWVWKLLSVRRSIRRTSNFG
jgi:Zn ribbon nucleic-acid-binding protein